MLFAPGPPGKIKSGIEAAGPQTSTNSCVAGASARAGKAIFIGSPFGIPVIEITDEYV